jgi:CDP-diacylglycerol--glycerol-3-phosphate 3-phosphatidyltransferase
MTERSEPPLEAASPSETASGPSAPLVAAAPAVSMTAGGSAAPLASASSTGEAATGEAAPEGGPSGALDGPFEGPEPDTSAAAPVVRVVSTWNIANALTIARLVIVPIFTVFLFIEETGWRVAALGVFLLASLTDQLDGWLARKYGLITDFGKMADPIADKALIGAALVSLSYLGEIPWWVTVVIIVREAGVTLLRFLVIRHGVIPASYGGKVKTVLQILAIALYIVPGVPVLVRWVPLGLALVVTVGTGVDYGIRAIRLRQVAKRARAA